MEGDSLLSWLIIAVLLCMAAYFAISEIAVTTVSRIRLRALAEQGNRKAAKAMFIQDNFDDAIATILIGTNIVHITTATLTTIMVTNTWGTGWVALGSICCTMAVFFAGEMLPKSLGKRYSESCALGTAGSLCVLMKLFAPLAKGLSAVGDFFSRIFKGEPEVTVTEEELHDIIETMTDEGDLNEARGDLVQSALEFDDVVTGRIFTPKDKVQAINVHASGEEILQFIHENNSHSRFPVYEGRPENIIGILPIRRYVHNYLRDGKIPELHTAMDRPYFVSTSVPGDELLQELSREKVSLAIVTDSKKRMLGIVTVEDILEEIVGEIYDEDDVAEGGDAE